MQPKRCIGLVLIGLMLIVGCAGRGPLLPTLLPEAAPVELAATPFFPQAAYQCGPAALAMVLRASDVTVTPDELVAKVYVPERKGSFQTELMATARRYGRLPYPIPPTLKSLMQELQAGRPVLVMQNLGLQSYPIWHYAVVIGFDPATDEILLRSGTDARQRVKSRKFLRTWQGADQWGLVMLRPGELPAALDRTAYLQATAAMEAVRRYDIALQGYQAALGHWPKNSMALLGLGNAYYALGQLDQAAAAYRQVLDNTPGHAVALNNLAQVLAEQGCYEAALAKVDAALRQTSLNPIFKPAVLRTRTGIVSGLSKGGLSNKACETH